MHIYKHKKAERTFIKMLKVVTLWTVRLDVPLNLFAYIFYSFYNKHIFLKSVTFFLRYIHTPQNPKLSCGKDCYLLSTFF